MPRLRYTPRATRSDAALDAAQRPRNTGTARERENLSKQDARDARATARARRAQVQAPPSYHQSAEAWNAGYRRPASRRSLIVRAAIVAALLIVLIASVTLRSTGDQLATLTAEISDAHVQLDELSAANDELQATLDERQATIDAYSE